MSDGNILDSAVFRAVFERLADQPRIVAITRIADDASPIIRARACMGYPFVLAARDGSARHDRSSLWTILERELARTELRVRTGTYETPYDYAHARTYVNVAVRDYLASLDGTVTGAPGYAANQPITLATAMALGGGPPAYAPAALEPPAAWLGPMGASTPLHKDSSDNFAIHLLGAKRWTLFPVRDAPHLRLRRTLGTRGFTDFAVSEIDLRHDDPPTGTTPITVDVEAGETLFVPAGWAHRVENLATSLTITYWIDPLRQRPLALEPKE